MFDRINPIAWIGLGGSAGGSLSQLLSYGMDRDAMLSLAGSIVAVGAVLVPAAVKWFRSFREAQRAEDLSDHDAHATQLAAEVIRRAEAEAKVAELHKVIEALRAAAQDPIPEPSPLQDGRHDGDQDDQHK